MSPWVHETEKMWADKKPTFKSIKAVFNKVSVASSSPPSLWANCNKSSLSELKFWYPVGLNHKSLCGLLPVPWHLLLVILQMEGANCCSRAVGHFFQLYSV